MPAGFDLLHCPVCDGPPVDPAVLDTAPLAVRCSGCGLGIEADLRLSPTAYARAEYDRHRNAGQGGNRWARFHHDSAVAACRFDQLAGVLPDRPGRVWVDVGCGAGAHLAAARRRGWTAAGVEADPDTAAEVTAVLGVPVFPYGAWVTTAAAGPAAVDVVSFFDSLEHLLDPVGALVAAAAAVRPGGLVVVEAPDLAAVRPADFPRWKHRRNAEFTEHVWHFSVDTVAAAVRRYLPGFEPVHAAAPVRDRFQVAYRRVSPSAGLPPSLCGFGLDFQDEVRRKMEDARLEQALLVDQHALLKAAGGRE